MLHTPAQHTSSSQPAVSGCASKQLPAHGQSQLARGTQRSLAAFTQVEFHWISQQSGSASHTMEQQVASAQPGVRCATSQGSSPGQSPKLQQMPLAMLTQRSFQPKLQQMGSTAHTAAQHSGSEHPPWACTTRGEPGPGQPLGAAQVTPALAAQVSSHAREQQVGSALQIDWQHASSSQAGR